MSTNIKQHTVFIIIPAYNEQSVIQSVLEKFHPYNYNIVVIDDGSEKKLNNVLANFPIYLLRHPVNLGQGAALKTGIEFALTKKADYIVTFDADGQHRVEDIKTLLSPLINNQADIVLGSRFMKGAVQNMPGKRKTLLQFARRFNYLFTGLLLSDAHNGLRAMNRKAAMCMQITENRMAHATEIISLIKKNKLKFIEVPVTVLYSGYSQKKGQTLGSSFRIFFDLLLNKFFK